MLGDTAQTQPSTETEQSPPPRDVLGIHNKLGQEIFISGCFGCMWCSCPHCHRTPVPSGLLSPSPTHSHPCCAPVLAAIALPSPSCSRSQPNRTSLRTKCASSRLGTAPSQLGDASSRLGIAPSVHHILATHRSIPAMHCSILAMYCSIPAMHHILAMHCSISAVHHIPAVHRFIPAVHCSIMAMHRCIPAVHRILAMHRSIPAVNRSGLAVYCFIRTAHLSIPALEHHLSTAAHVRGQELAAAGVTGEPFPRCGRGPGVGTVSGQLRYFLRCTREKK
ncbi:interleukin-15 receptor subunit alpha isoform X1 [Harpia harpyja]|uniref:interleukin-15 receptor subunit alpha isoform X1 n=1 Tax=Harpia harpyja TaxID=202280 RepID=UPI0022B09E7E|nr:interleukin-15 receptor subunit alpha isoform X1 [Harpia harpyja]XP_052645338.1 interleukin-15 receptor subunit alpha isoform X1 [Harpia harpyja]